MKIVGLGQVNIWRGGSLWIGVGRGGVDPHAHHAIQLTLGLRGTVRLRPAGSAEWTEHVAALVPPHLPHAFESDDSVLALLFCEPESVLGRALLARFGADRIAALPPDLAAACCDRLRTAYAAEVDDPELNGVAQSLLADLAGPVSAAQGAEPRVRRAIAEIERRIATPISLGQVASALCLSPSRLRHLFAAETGLSFRGYVLWMRLQAALEHAVGGATWTEAAHEAGFADSAHLTRTFRRTFGFSPAGLRHDQRAFGRAALSAD
jgi:AraC-like DNA-binding protein